MKIVTVIPIAKGIPRDELSYFSAKEISVGTVVTVPFGKRMIDGVVVDFREVRDMKASVKTSDFQLRNVTKIHGEKLPVSLFMAAQKTARFFAQPIGPVLKTMIPDAVFDYLITNPAPEIRPMIKPDLLALQIPTSERMSYYKTLIRENLAKQNSTMIIAPTIAQAEQIFSMMKSGIESSIVVIHSKTTKKNQKTIVDRVVGGREPIVVIATAPWVTLLRNDWHTVVLEQASSNSYRYSFGPILDMRFFIEQVATAYGAHVISADTFLESSIRSRITNHSIIDARSTWHISKPENFSVIDMKTDTITNTKKSFAVFDPETIKMITRAHDESASLVLVTSRKGLAPITICGDCGTAVTCPQCDTPLVLHRTHQSGDQTTRRYLCHHCMYLTDPWDFCAQCRSYKLKPLGISTETIASELEHSFPKLPVTIIDGDTTATPAAIKKSLDAWHTKKGALVITASMLHLIDMCDYGCVVSVDSLLSLPSYTSGERTLGILLGFLEKISRGAIIQTRIINHSVIQAIATENTFDFIKNEITTREQFGYPPAKILVKISTSIEKTQVPGSTVFLEKLFGPYDPDIAMKRAEKNTRVIISVIMKIEPEVWSDMASDIHAIISELEPFWKIEINPDTVW